ncbi:hypothetical protein CRUP_005815, partial [Coryphaenoides rupestris]
GVAAETLPEPDPPDPHLGLGHPGLQRRPVNLRGEDGSSSAGGRQRRHRLTHTGHTGGGDDPA